MKARRVKGLDPSGALIDNAERIVATRLQELIALAPKALGRGEVKALHDMRIAAKRLRYALEVMGDLFGPYATEARRHAKELQDLLGEVHDCDVLEPRLLALIEELREADVAAIRAGREPEHAADHAGLELLVVRTRARREDLFARFGALWAGLERDAFQTRLEEAIAEREVQAA